MIFPRLLRVAALLSFGTAMYAGGWWHHSRLGTAAVSIAPAPPVPVPLSVVPPPSISSITDKTNVLPADRLSDLLQRHASPNDLALALSDWAVIDPAAAFAAFLTDPRLQYPNAAHALFHTFGKNDPTHGLSLLDQLPPQPWTRQAVTGLAAGWAGNDPQAAASAGLALPKGTRRSDFLSAALLAWFPRDMPAALAWLKTLPPDDSARQILSSSELNISGIKSPQEMTFFLELYRQAPSSQTDVLINQFRTYTETNPGEAIQWALHLPDETPGRDDIIKTALDAAAADPAQATALLASLSDPRERIYLLQSAAQSWAKIDPVAALEWGATLADPEHGPFFQEKVIAAWTLTDPERAVPWLMQNKPARIEDWGHHAALSWAAISPDATLAWLGELSPGKMKDDLTAGALSVFIKSNPTQAFDRILATSHPDFTGDLLEDATKELAQQDITAASARVAELAPGRDRDMAIRGLLGAAFKAEPDSALTWANAIQNPDSKQSLMRKYFPGWLEKDPAAARAWLDRTPMDETLRQTIQVKNPY